MCFCCRPLPKGWVVRASKSRHGRNYFFNVVSGISSWKHPSDLENKVKRLYTMIIQLISLDWRHFWCEMEIQGKQVVHLQSVPNIICLLSPNSLSMTERGKGSGRLVASLIKRLNTQ